MNLLIRLIVTGAVAYALTSLLPGIHIDSFWTAFVLAFVLAILHFIVKPILIILTLPLTIVTFGLFVFIINALIILLADAFIDGFSVGGFWWALLFSLLLSLVTAIISPSSKEKE